MEARKEPFFVIALTKRCLGIENWGLKNFKAKIKIWETFVLREKFEKDQYRLKKKKKNCNAVSPSPTVFFAESSGALSAYAGPAGRDGHEGTMTDELDEEDVPNSLQTDGSSKPKGKSRCGCC